jgi:hypothetical protein
MGAAGRPAHWSEPKTIVLLSFAQSGSRSSSPTSFSRRMPACPPGLPTHYFGMSVSAPYLEATVTTAAVAHENGDLEVSARWGRLSANWRGDNEQNPYN